MNFWAGLNAMMWVFGIPAMVLWAVAMKDGKSRFIAIIWLVIALIVFAVAGLGIRLTCAG